MLTNIEKRRKVLHQQMLQYCALYNFAGCGALLGALG